MTDPAFANAGDGQSRWIVARGKIERDADGRAMRLVGAHMDAARWARGALAIGGTRSRQTA